MNNTINEIKKLLWEKDISSKDFSRNNISTYIQEMIKEKVNIVSDYEKFNPQFLIDQEVARQDELKIDNKYVA